MAALPPPSPITPVSDARRDRDRWKLRAEAAEARVAELEAVLRRIEGRATAYARFPAQPFTGHELLSVVRDALKGEGQDS